MLIRRGPALDDLKLSTVANRIPTCSFHFDPRHDEEVGSPSVASRVPDLPDGEFNIMTRPHRPLHFDPDLFAF